MSNQKRVKFTLTTSNSPLPPLRPSSFALEQYPIVQYPKKKIHNYIRGGFRRLPFSRSRRSALCSFRSLLGGLFLGLFVLVLFFIVIVDVIVVIVILFAIIVIVVIAIIFVSRGLPLGRSCLLRCRRLCRSLRPVW